MKNGIFLPQKLSAYQPKRNKSFFFQNIFQKNEKKNGSSKTTEKKFKVYKLVKNSFICKYQNFSLAINKFHTPSFSGVKKHNFTSNIFILEFVLMASTHWEKLKKLQLVLNILDVAIN